MIICSKIQRVYLQCSINPYELKVLERISCLKQEIKI